MTGSDSSLRPLSPGSLPRRSRMKLRAAQHACTSAGPHPGGTDVRRPGGDQAGVSGGFSRSTAKSPAPGGPGDRL
jgi:hypothetical protein